MHAVLMRFDDRPQERDGRPFAIRSGDVQHRVRLLQRELLQYQLDPLQAEIDFMRGKAFEAGQPVRERGTRLRHVSDYFVIGLGRCSNLASKSAICSRISRRSTIISIAP